MQLYSQLILKTIIELHYEADNVEEQGIRLKKEKMNKIILPGK